MKKTVFLILLMMVPVLVFGQAKRTRVRNDSLYIVTSIDVGGNNVTTLLKDRVSSNQVLSTGLGDSSVSTAKIKESAVTDVKIADSTITTAKFTAAAYAMISSGGSVTNNPDDVTLKGSTTLYVYNPFGRMDTLTANSATPTIADYQWYRTKNTATTAITGFTNSPSASVPKVVYIDVRDNYTTFTHSTNFDCGGVSLAPQSGDILACFWTGAKWQIKFEYIE